jgi:hypothetical protein
VRGLVELGELAQEAIGGCAATGGLVSDAGELGDETDPPGAAVGQEVARVLLVEPFGGSDLRVAGKLEAVVHLQDEDVDAEAGEFVHEAFHLRQVGALGSHAMEAHPRGPWRFLRSVS